MPTNNYMRISVSNENNWLHQKPQKPPYIQPCHGTFIEPTEGKELRLQISFAVNIKKGIDDRVENATRLDTL